MTTVASVHLRFFSPRDPNLIQLHILEAANPAGPFTVIETVNEIGPWPDYITAYTTDQAVNIGDYFAIQWEDDKGAKSPVSMPIKGDTITLIGEVYSRVRLRDPSFDDEIVAQEAAAVIEWVFGTDPPDITEVTQVQLSGLTYLTMARIYLGQIMLSSQTQSYTAGLVQEKSGTAQTIQGNVDNLIALANQMLGFNISLVMLMADNWPGTSVSAIDRDISRLSITLYAA